MADSTPNLHLIKPDQEEFYNVQDFNDNADRIDAAFGEHTGQAVGAEGAHGLRIRDGKIQTASGDQWTDVDVKATNATIESIEGLQEALDGKSDITHAHTAEEVGAVPISGGTMEGVLLAAENTDTGVPAIRNIYANTQDLQAGVSELPIGVIYLVYQ